MSVDLEQTLVALLKAQSGVTSLIGQRLYPNHAQQGMAYPYAVYTGTGGQPVMTMGGPVALTNLRMDFECCADTFAAVKSVALAIGQVLSGFSGQVVNFLRLKGVFIEDGGDSYEPPQHDDDIGVYCRTIHANIWFDAV